MAFTEAELIPAETNGVTLSTKFVQQAWLAFIILGRSKDTVIRIPNLPASTMVLLKLKVFLMW